MRSASELANVAKLAREVTEGTLDGAPDKRAIGFLAA